MSRFAYHTGVDEPLEGGVRAAVPKDQKRTVSRPHAATNGVPGPDETLLDITELVRNVGMQYVHSFAIPADYEPELSAAAPIVGKVTLTNAGATLLLRGNVATQLELECGRCLAPCIESVEAELEESYDLVSTHPGRHHEDIEAIDSDNPEAPVIAGNVLNLGELLRQILLVAAPLTTTCGDDCPNLARIVRPDGGASAEAPHGPLSRLGELLKKQ
jgi:uncharacterized metal-binding protein YceD (DUF177 family)